MIFRARVCRITVIFLFAAAAAFGLDYDVKGALNALGQAEFRWDPFFSSGVLSAGDHEAVFSAGKAGEKGPVIFDNRELYTLPLPYASGGTLTFPGELISAVKTIFNRLTEEENTRFRIAAVIVDPGHGGKDSGAIGEHTIDGKPFKSVEKDIVLTISKLLYEKLAASFPDKKILMTRTGDTYPTLDDRVTLANAVPLRDNEAIIYLSVHANASVSSSARGFEVWYLSPGYRRDLIDKSKYGGDDEVLPILNTMMEEEFTTESILIAQGIVNRFREIFGNKIPNRGIKAEEWFVVRNSQMPAVLVELGFVTNEADARLMADPAGIKNYADALFLGVSDFITLFEKSGGFTR